MTTPQFTLDWPYGWMTRREEDVEIYCTDVPGDWPIQGRIIGRQIPEYWRDDGSYDLTPGCPHYDDLINRPAPTVSVPVDKLHDGAIDVLEGNIWYIPVQNNERLQIGALVKWFYADEAEIEK